MNNFNPGVAKLVNPLQGLLRKDIAFNWLPEHEEAFRNTKKELTRTMTLHHFNTNMQTILVTDASRTGLGFAIMQVASGEPPRIVQCGSRALTSAEKNYAVIELETLGIVWAISKCQFFLIGIGDFEVVCDHRPQMGLFAKPLSSIENNRLVNLR